MRRREAGMFQGVWLEQQGRWWCHLPGWKKEKIGGGRDRFGGGREEIRVPHIWTSSVHRLYGISPLSIPRICTDL